MKEELERGLWDLRGIESSGYKNDSRYKHVPHWSCAGIPAYQVSRIALNSMGSEKCSSSLSSDWARAAGKKVKMTEDEKMNVAHCNSILPCGSSTDSSSISVDCKRDGEICVGTKLETKVTWRLVNRSVACSISVTVMA